MGKYIRMLIYEFKNIVRDKMTLIMLLYPLLMIALGSYVIPVLIDNYGTTSAGQEMASLVIIIVFANVAPFATAAMLGFSLLDHKDENTLDTIRVTPLSLKGYVTFKTIYAYVIAVNASFWAIQGVRLLSGDGYTYNGINLWSFFSLSDILFFALVAGLFTPVFAMLLAAMSKNKIEGFAYMKTTGMLTLIPAIIVLDAMQDFKQYFIGIIPTFWPTKGLLVGADLLDHAHNLNFWGYMIIGLAYSLALTVLCFKVFENNIQN